MHSWKRFVNVGNFFNFLNAQQVFFLSIFYRNNKYFWKCCPMGFPHVSLTEWGKEWLTWAWFKHVLLPPIMAKVNIYICIYIYPSKSWFTQPWFCFRMTQWNCKLTMWYTNWENLHRKANDLKSSVGCSLWIVLIEQYHREIC